MSEGYKNNLQVTNVKTCSEKANKSCEKVVLLSIKATVENSSNLSKSDTYLFLDSGSQLSFISEKLAQKLNLKPLTEEVLSIYTFAANRPLRRAIQLVEFHLVLRNEERKLIQAYVMNKISEELQAINDNGKTEMV